ncbi:MAG: class I SAM-dependent methyltransferase [Pseudomonadota bacterium]
MEQMTRQTGAHAALMRVPLDIPPPPVAPVSWHATQLDARATRELGRWLLGEGYHHTTVTPDTHGRVLAHRAVQARNLRDVFGWSQPFAQDLLPFEALDLLVRAGAVEPVAGGLLRSRIRFSSLDDLLLVHSAYPTTAADAVFFGPDTYRFARLIERTLSQSRTPIWQIIDVGCGTGAGGLFAARRLGATAHLTLLDLSDAALHCARINAAVFGIRADCRRSDLLHNVQGSADLILCNPPYLIDPAHRLYRDGGGTYGDDMSMRVVVESLPRLRPGGRLVLYTGSAIVDGIDSFRSAVEPVLLRAGARFDYSELDPDVFGDELDQPAYAGVERIAAIGLVVHAPAVAPLRI